jgi:predicted nucleic acid-binding protein
VILVDTSVWVDHLRDGDEGLSAVLEGGHVLAHPFVAGELALGHLRQRELVLHMLGNLPQATVATDAEVLQFIDRHALSGTGIGYVDAHLLAAVRLTAAASIWTRDRTLLGVAKRLDLATADADTR